jgi:putative glutamine amidotransferase
MTTARTAAAARPLYIGITARASTPDWLQRNVRNYLSMVASYRAVPIVLAPDSAAVLPDGTAFPLDERGRLPAEVLHALDGVILSGGGDVDPSYFGQELAGAEPESIDPRRDEQELDLVQAALARDLPIFGICRGCQVLNVAAGGQMIQHLDGHRSPEAGPTRFHPVAVAPDSALRGIVGTGEFAVNTFHHQGMDAATLAPGFRPAAVAKPDGWLVEAYESLEHRWVVGVQWHPERTFELDEPHLRLWDSFVAACWDGRARS